MDLKPIEADRNAVPLPVPSQPMPLDPIRAVAALIFLLMVPILILPYWLVLGVGIALVSAANLVHATLIYCVDVTVGRRIGEIR